MGESKAGKCLELDKKQNGERRTSFTLAGVHASSYLIFGVPRDGLQIAR